MKNTAYVKNQIDDLERDKAELFRSVENLLKAVTAARAHVFERALSGEAPDALELMQILDVKAG